MYVVHIRKVTFASTAPYILTKPLLFNERLMHICGVEIVIVRHPTYFHENYMTGSAYYIQDGIVSETVSFDTAHFDGFLNGV